MRPIDADALEQKAKMIYMDMGNTTMTQRVVGIADIHMAPTINAEPVRHGRWIPCKGKSHIWYCSECGEKINYNQARRTYKIEKKPVWEVNKRCRVCGARMDGGAPDER